MNGVPAGSRDVERNGHVEWRVPYAPGAIEARGYKDGRLALTTRRETTGAPARVVLRADRTRIAADGEDCAVIRAEIQDAQGRMVPTANNLVTFSLGGRGAIIGVGNGDPTSLEADKASERRAFNGLCMAIAQADKRAGALSVRATSPGAREWRGHRSSHAHGGASILVSAGDSDEAASPCRNRRARQLRNGAHSACPAERAALLFWRRSLLRQRDGRLRRNLSHGRRAARRLSHLPRHGPQSRAHPHLE
ncbi:MAG: DUF4982 domain-containing protein [Terricaulis sp.]